MELVSPSKLPWVNGTKGNLFSQVNSEYKDSALTTNLGLLFTYNALVQAGHKLGEINKYFMTSVCFAISIFSLLCNKLF